MFRAKPEIVGVIAAAVDAVRKRLLLNLITAVLKVIARHLCENWHRIWRCSANGLNRVAQKSESETSAELYFPRCAIRTGDLAKAGVLRRAARSVRVGIVRSIRKVEGIYLEAGRHVLPNIY